MYIEFVPLVLVQFMVVFVLVVLVVVVVFRFISREVVVFPSGSWRRKGEECNDCTD